MIILIQMMTELQMGDECPLDANDDSDGMGHVM